MTNGRELTKTPVPDSRNESDRRKWTHKRAQFDSAINTARLLGVVQNIAMGNMEANEALRIILEVNAATDQAQYVAEMLAMKKEFRELARLDFIPEIAKFIANGSRLVPSLTEGLASQMLMAMGHAAQNDAYLETVSGAVSALLSDLDHPLATDARNYLRLLWDQMEATRKLKQTEARYTRQTADESLPPPERDSSSSIAKPDVHKPVLPETPEPPPNEDGRSSVERPSAGPIATPKPQKSESLDAPIPFAEIKAQKPADAPIPFAELMAQKSADAPIPRAEPKAQKPDFSDAPVPSAEPKPHRRESSDAPIPFSQILAARDIAENPPSAPGVRKATMIGIGDTRRSPPSSGRQNVASRGDSPREALVSQPKPIIEVANAASAATDTGAALSDDFEDVTRRQEVKLPVADTLVASPHEPAAKTHAIESWFEEPPPLEATEPPQRELPASPRQQKAFDEFKLPTSGAPRWAVAVVLVVALAAAGVVIALVSTPEQKPVAPSHSASALPSVSASSPGPARSAAPIPKTQLPKPVVPPPSVAPALPSQVPAAVPLPQPKVPPPVIEPVPVRLTKSAKPLLQGPAPATSSRGVEPATKTRQSSIVTPPDVSKTLSPLDRILAELRLISPDPLGIEDKARELARIIAHSKRKEASQIIEKLGPPVAVDLLGHDSNLEESLQIFAVSVLGRVATDDDDNRAVDALLMLGEWVKNGGRGRQKALSVLTTLSNESIVKTSAPRLRALKTAQAQAD
jgi:hypothetical protein